MKRTDWYLSTIDPQAQITAREYGLGLEIADFCIPGTLDDGFPEADRAVLEKLRGIPKRVLHGPFNELFPCAVDPKARALARERFKQAVDLAARYNASKVVLHGGFNPWLYYPCWYKEQSVLFWKAFLPEIPAGVTVCLENVLEKTPDMLLEIVTGVDSEKIALCLDVGHVNAYSPVPVSEWIDRYGTQLCHLHIHNNDGSADTHSPLSAGSLDIPAIVSRARAVSPGASFTLELPQAAESVRWLAEQLTIDNG